jgi:hypothetical protein
MTTAVQQQFFRPRVGNTQQRKRQVAITQVRMRLRQFRTAEQWEAAGWRDWYGEMFGLDWVQSLAPHHREAIEWHWNALQAKLRGDFFRHDTYIAIWSRGHMKSTIARRIAVADACLSTRVKKGGYCLYVSGTKDKVRGHALSLETLITSKQIRKYYPGLASVRKSGANTSKGWTRNFIYTQAGYVFHFASLDEEIAGANVDNVRPTLIVPDDIDDRKQSPAVAEARYQVFTREVLPTKQTGTLFFLAQNLINRFSVTYRIHRGRSRILANRQPTRPIPALTDLETEQRVESGIVKDVITAGQPTWAAYTVAHAQKDIDTYGLEAFLAECQHKVEQQRSGMVLPEWNEAVHVITWSEFERVYGQRSIPGRWTKYIGHDWGNTHPCVVSCVATAAQGDPLAGTHFLYAGLTFPQNTQSDDVALAIIERLAPQVSTASARNLSPDVVAQHLAGGVTGLLNAPREMARRTIRDQVATWAAKSQITLWHMSHEQKTIRDNYLLNYGLPFSACNPGASGGVEQIRSYLRTDMDQPHPFRKGEAGLAGFYFIVDDDQGVRMQDGEAVSLARDDRGLKLWRDQFPEWIWRDPTLSEAGLQADRPVKVNDDAGNTLMMIFAHFALSTASLTAEQEVEAALPSRLRAGEAPADQELLNGWLAARQLALEKAQREFDQRDAGNNSFWNDIV